MSAPNPQFRFNPITGRLDLSDTAGGGGGGDGSGGVTSWVTVTSSTQTVAPGIGYVANNPLVPVVFTIPITFPFGKVFRIVGRGSEGWSIAQQIDQIIHYGAEDTTTGVLGGLSSTNRHDCVEILCTVADLEFEVINGPQGNLNYF